MLDHVLGRPSVTVRKWQVLTAVVAWILYILRGNRHGPPGVRRISTLLTRRLSAWQTVVLVGIVHYILRNLGKLLGLECPEPLANLYEPAYFRATWATTALDAGFWTAMPIRRKWLAHISSILFTGYYLINAEQADEKVRLVRSVITVEHLRNSWNKTLFNPILKLSTWLLRPRTMRYAPREIRIPRSHGSKYKDPVLGWLYFDGPITALKRQTKLILNIPGGGFVAMSPRTHDDSLMSWAAKTGIPILSLDYRKAPEHPYPYALHECFDVYRQLILSRGRCAGLFTASAPQIVISGDSAGGNLAAGLTLMILNSSSPTRQPPPTPLPHRKHTENLPPPSGLILIYPCLDVNIGNWMTDEQMSLIRDKASRGTNHRVLRRKKSVYMRTANTPYASDASSSPSPSRSPSPPPYPDVDSDEDIPQPHLNLLRPSPSNPDDFSPAARRKFKTPIAVPSMLSYFSDRVLTPEMMRAMIILYIGQRRKPDFSTDYYLSPVLAPEELLARFPRTHFLTGERDPLVDDTCVMAGRLRRAKGGDVSEDVKVELIPGVSHGFMQMAALYPKAWFYIDLVAGWYDELFRAADRDELNELYPVSPAVVRDSRMRESPPLRMEALERHDVEMAKANGNGNGHALNGIAGRVNGEANGVDGGSASGVNGEANGADGGFEEGRKRHHHRTPTAATNTSEDSDAGLEIKMKPLTSSLHGNGSARKPRRKDSNSPTKPKKSRRKSYENGRHRSNHEVDAESKDAGDVKGLLALDGADDEHNEINELEGGEENTEAASKIQSPFAREHPISRGSTWDLKREPRRRSTKSSSTLRGTDEE